MTMLPPPHDDDDLSKQEDQKFENCVVEEEGGFGYGYGGFSCRRRDIQREGFGTSVHDVMSRVEVVEGYYNRSYKCYNNNSIWSSENSWAGNCDQNIIGVPIVMGDRQEEEEEEEKGRISSRSNSVSVSLNEAGGGGSSSKGTTTSNVQQAEKDEGGSSWLQLGIPSSQTLIHHKQEMELLPISSTSSTTPLVELDLLPAPPHPPLNPEHQACRPIMIQPQPHAQAQAQALEIRGAALMNMSYPASNMLFQQTPTTGGPPPPIHHHHHHQDSSSTWAFGPIPYMGMGMGLMPPPSSSSSFRSLPLHSHPHHHLASYFPRPFQFAPACDEAAGLGPGPGPSSNIRVVDPPRRPHSGIWFMLQASPTQAKEPFLPQIPKSYLRIK
ncbi:protein LAX PANICLE 2-like isoform X1 [Senna tora]|uniref:Protein LAX PANICLE 2-like isoform X1 n=1 Tax=Senna tora TaxID=362788 RepID=A0A834X6M8_9FABA|nr:protein LAX PANICLE 2-like isoform X1 [Senna tora]